MGNYTGKRPTNFNQPRYLFDRFPRNQFIKKEMKLKDLTKVVLTSSHLESAGAQNELVGVSNLLLENLIGTFKETLILYLPLNC